MSFFKNVLDFIPKVINVNNKVSGYIENKFNNILDSEFYENSSRFFAKSKTNIITFLVKNLLKEYKYVCYSDIKYEYATDFKFKNKFFINDSMSYTPNSIENYKCFFVISIFSKNSTSKIKYSQHELQNSSYVKYVPQKITLNPELTKYDMITLISINSCYFCFKTETEMLKFKLLHM